MYRNKASNWDELLYNQGKKYYEEALHTTDRIKRLALLKKSASRNFIPGCTRYGTLLCQSERSADREKDLRILEKAAKYESVASCNLSLLHFAGDIVQKDIPKALHYAENAKNPLLSTALENLLKPCGIE